jgi:surface polysaccharide O-acyltransferase-like enzyme
LGVNGNISSFSVYDYFNFFFGINRYPVNYHLWYLRDLMILCLFSPLIYYCIVKIPCFIWIVFLVAFLNLYSFSMCSINSIFYFCLGATFALKYKKKPITQNVNIVLLISFLLIFCLYVLKFSNNVYFYFAMRLLGVFVFCNFFISIEKVRLFFRKFSNSAFFIYLFHEPLLTLIKRSEFFLFRENINFWYLFFFFFNIIVILFVLFTARSFFLKMRLKIEIFKFLM